MAFIRTISPSWATGELKAVYQDVGRVLGTQRVVNILRVFSLRPGSLRAAMRQWELAFAAAQKVDGPRLLHLITDLRDIVPFDGGPEAV